MDLPTWELSILRLFVSECYRDGVRPSEARAAILWRCRAYSQQLAGKHQFTMAHWARVLHSDVLRHETVNDCMQELRARLDQPPYSNRGVKSLSTADSESLGVS